MTEGGLGPVRTGGPLWAVVPCAGASRRMGRSKALLPAGDRLFVERIVETLLAGGVDEVVVVVRPGERPERGIAQRAGARIVVNPDPDHPERGGPVSSVRAALPLLPPDVCGLLVHPVDHPRLEPSTVAALIAAFRGRGAPVTQPVWRGRRGHPVVLHRELFHEIEGHDLPEGLRSLIARHAAGRHEVHVDDPGVSDDIDTPQEYDDVFGGEVET